MRWMALGSAAVLAVIMPVPASAEPVRQGVAQVSDADLSAQSRRNRRTRVTVRPRRYDTGDRPVYSSDRRECRAVFQERLIPEWGGRVLYAGQDCRWVR